MADRVIPLKMVNKIWRVATEDNSKSISYLIEERGLKEENIDKTKIGYIDYLKLDKSFFLKDVIVFPLYGADGKLKGVTTRKLYDKFFIKFVTSNYPLIFSDYEFSTKTLVLVESPICALTLRPYLPDMEVAASLSASITMPYLVMFSTAKKIITLMDNDDAGQRASDTISKINPKAYITPKHIYENSKDVNEIYKEDYESFENLVRYIQTIDRKTK